MLEVKKKRVWGLTFVVSVEVKEVQLSFSATIDQLPLASLSSSNTASGAVNDSEENSFIHSPREANESECNSPHRQRCSLAPCLSTFLEENDSSNDSIDNEEWRRCRLDSTSTVFMQSQENLLPERNETSVASLHRTSTTSFESDDSIESEYWQRFSFISGTSSFFRENGLGPLPEREQISVASSQCSSAHGVLECDICPSGYAPELAQKDHSQAAPQPAPPRHWGLRCRDGRIIRDDANSMMKAM
jgi:hypothetical protein